MNCRKFESQLEWFLTRKLPPASMLQCRAHLESCSRCRELLDLASREPVPIEPAHTEDLVRTVLEKTSGQSCRRAHEWLADYVDGALAATPAELMERHLANCHSCRQIYRIMRELKEALPGLAHMDPGNGFTLECMHAFRRLPNRRSLSKSPAGRIWQRWLVRPRLAMESAYVLTLLLFVLIKLFAFIPGASRVEVVSDLQSKSIQVSVSMAGAIKEHLNEWRLSLTERRDQWAKASSKNEEEIFSTLRFMGNKTRQYSRSTANAVIELPRSIWNVIGTQVEKILPKDGTAI